MTSPSGPVLTSQETRGSPTQSPDADADAADGAAPTDVHALHAPGAGPFPPATKIQKLCLVRV